MIIVGLSVATSISSPPVTHGLLVLFFDLLVFSIFFDGRWGRLSSVSVSRLGQRPTAKRPQGLDIDTERRMLPVSEEDLCRCCFN